MKILVAADAGEHARLAAEALLGAIEGRAGTLSICLPGGSTPGALYRLLKEPPYSGRMPWSRTHFFLSDERYVPDVAPESNLRMLRGLLDHVPLPVSNVHGVDTSLGSLELSADAFGTDIARRRTAKAQAPLSDIAVLGVGTDGHTPASLFPGSPALAQMERFAVAVATASVPPFLPRVSMTLRALASTRSALFLARGAEKREILNAIKSGNSLPARQLSEMTHATWLLDEALDG
ncbi:MAG: 6-phosphogluconolactonase [Betaproteobacteria bacterium]|nr:6-phosphogluconolactonase [Betaproteobacteria bacterium]